ncbi:MAG: hypothetical protein SLAVMIC_01018 [uncultured marine phage]|uniref:Uncharacterized protein n=1 Tax=uncultured marine phage TaxID=707152 RepID=A0A8D9FS10_9VIRU|nr:MAG: hypothetical protein SLAVMIC_01018 [uncultured marine phage]
MREIISKKDYPKFFENIEDFLGGGSDGTFEHIERYLTMVDDGDGGSYYEVIFKRLSDGKYFCLSYCDWDDVDKAYCNFQMSEVVPKQITKTIWV